MDESTICGREGDKEEIMKVLLSDNVTCNQVPVVSIVGMDRKVAERTNNRWTLDGMHAVQLWCDRWG